VLLSVLIVRVGEAVGEVAGEPIDLADIEAPSATAAAHRARSPSASAASRACSSAESA
jgi:hypothetical protein